MCLLLQEIRSDHLELSYYAISSHLDNQNSRKPVVRAFFTHIDAVITRTNEVLRPKYFFKLMTQSQENDQKPILWPKCGLFWPIFGRNIFSATKTTATC